ncbi:MAG: WecB/TagA/CpsF family glycosyltransferase [Steroidobacteraceae bacterium]
MRRGSVQILNACLDKVTLDEAVGRIIQAVQARAGGWVCTVNVSFAMMMRSDPKLQLHVDRAFLALADGQPLVWASRLLGRGLPERVAGIDVVDGVCSEAARRAIPVFLLGSSEQNIRRAAEELRAKFPGLDIRYHHGFFPAADFSAIASIVAGSGARVLLCGMGVPRQEYFIADQWGSLGVDVAIGVGGSFEVISGHLSRAPLWMQKCGLEWVHRLLQEPARLFPRYFTTGVQFGALMVAAMFALLIGRRP